MFSAIVKIYGNNVINGRKTFEEVPAKISEDVRDYILSINPTFFDVPEETPVEEVPEETEIIKSTSESSSSGNDEE